MVIFGLRDPNYSRDDCFKGFLIRGNTVLRISLHKVTKVHLYEYALRVYIHSYIIYTYRCFYLICICMPILFMFIHSMHEVGLGVGVGGVGDTGQKVKRLYTIYVFPFEGCILYMYIHI